MTPANPSPPEDGGEHDTTEVLGEEDRQQRIVILTGRKAEYEQLLNGSFDRKLVQNHPYWAQDRNDFQIRLSHLGIGKDQSEKSLGQLQSMLEGDLLIVAGTAGSLHGDLTSGDVFVPTALAPTDAVEWSHPDQELLHWLVGLISHSELDLNREGTDSNDNLRMGPMVTSPRPVIEPEQRDELRELTGAMAVDMESAHAVEEFRQAQDEENQWLCLRVISDGTEIGDTKEAEALQKPACERLNHLLQELIDSL